MDVLQATYVAAKIISLGFYENRHYTIVYVYAPTMDHLLATPNDDRRTSTMGQLSTAFNVESKTQLPDCS